MNNVTKEEWKIMEKDPLFYDIGNGGDRTALVPIVTANAEANANLIVTCVNACKAISPDDPQRVAENIKGMYEALKEALIVVKYVQSRITGYISSEGIETGKLALKIQELLSRIEQKEA